MTAETCASTTTDVQEQDLPDAVGEALYELSMEESTDFVQTYHLGDCNLPEGEFALSTSMDTAIGSVSFITDGRGTIWLAWQVYAERRSGARRVSPSDDVGELARFCFLILYGPHSGPSQTRVCH